MNTGAEPGKLILSWEFWEFWEFWERLLPVGFTGNLALGIFGNFGNFGNFWKRIATDIVTTWKDRNCLILLYITFGGLSLASEAATGKN